MFRDPNFGENKKEFYAFMEALIKNDLKITWSCETRLDIFSLEDLKLMYRAGLRYVITGIESNNAQLLKDNLRQPYEEKDASRKIETLEKAGAIVQTNYILGFPHETERSVLDTIEYAKELNSMFATFHIFTPQPGTSIFEDYKDIIEGHDIRVVGNDSWIILSMKDLALNETMKMRAVFQKMTNHTATPKYEDFHRIAFIEM